MKEPRAPYKIQEVVKLGFDPAATTDADFKHVFGDPTAWILWLLWRPGHLVDDRFSRECLLIAKYIDTHKPQTVEKLAWCFDVSSPFNFTHSDITHFCEAALPYFTGEKTVSYEITKR
jgi:hypothetical protein